VKDEGQALVPGNPGEERRQGTSRGVGAMEVLEDEQTGRSSPSRPRNPQDSLERSRLAPLGDRHGGPRGEQAQRSQPPRELRHEADRFLDGRAL
jgi:hypothetical protein